MRKLLILTLWLVLLFTGLTLFVYSPYSQHCEKSSVEMVMYTDDGKGIIVRRTNTSAFSELWTENAERPVPVIEPRSQNVTTFHQVGSHSGKYLLKGADGYAEFTTADGVVPFEKQTWITFPYHNGKPGGNFVDLIAIGPDEKTILIGSTHDHMAELWDIQGHTLLHSFNNFPNLLQSLAYSTDGKAIITGNTGPAAIIWDTQTGKPTQILITGGNPVGSVAFSTHYAITATYTGLAQVWDAQSGQLLRILNNRRGLAAGLGSIAIAPDEKTAVIGEYGDYTVLEWTLQTGTPIRVLCPLVLGRSVQLTGALIEIVTLGLSLLFFYRLTR